jgi:hypothetical protein
MNWYTTTEIKTKKKFNVRKILMIYLKKILRKEEKLFKKINHTGNVIVSDYKYGFKFIILIG